MTRVFVYVLRAAAAALVLSAAGCASPLVGAECAEGAQECGGRCVDLSSDPEHCGACGNECEGACDQGMCLGGSVSDCDSPGGGCGVDGGTASSADAGLPQGDAGSDDDDTLACDLGERACDGMCVDPSTDPQHCGTCGNVCDSDEVCSSGSCTLDCEGDTQACGDLCVDVSENPDHCGSCGNACESGLCSETMCQESRAGDVVVIGHDYSESRVGMNRLLGNAVFLAFGQPVQVVAYENDASPEAIAGANAAIDQVASESGASWERTPISDPDAVPLALDDADVFVVYAQADASDAELVAAGDSWQTALSSFLNAGGVVVVLDGGGDHSGTFQVLEPGGLFSAEGRADVTGGILEVARAGDSVAVNVPLEYTAEQTSIAIETDDAAIVEDDRGVPVVIHNIVY